MIKKKKISLFKLNRWGLQDVQNVRLTQKRFLVAIL